ncbi:MAG: D-alanine--D-alanine ligase [Planctomycetota bacterium]|nr:MAG: D-alanine--D-alanine ligase [Planctomycetota bacterium]
MADSKLKVAVLMGGIGEERDISIQSGRSVAQALRQAGINVITSDIGPNNLDILEDDTIDVFFIALHGKFGEDGQLQQILEDKSLCYTGSGAEASKSAFDKLASKECFVNAGITAPRAISFDGRPGPAELEKQLLQLSERFVIKPARQGSTIGVTIADNPKSALEAAQQCLCKFGDCIIEEFIPGKEITVGILTNMALPIIEIRSKTGFYDYQAKYIDEQTEYLFDTIDPIVAAKIQADAISCFNALGLRHFARVDFRLSDDRIGYALEANTIPGLTTHSLLPKAAEKAGIPMSELCVRIIKAALKNKNNKQHLFNQTVNSQT